MYIPKRYGESKIDRCPFCEKQAFSKNAENVPVCADHKNETLGDLKCMCGDTLAMLQGKFGVFFTCSTCGNMNLKKALEINPIKPGSAPVKMQATANNHEKNKNYEKRPLQTKKEMTVRSDDPRYFS